MAGMVAGSTLQRSLGGTITTGTTATRVGAPTTGVAGGRTGTVSAAYGGVAASPYSRPATTAPTPAPAAAAPKTPYVNPFADDGKGFERQMAIQQQMDARSQANQQIELQRQQMQMMMQPQQQQQPGYQPQPFQLPEPESPAAGAPEQQALIMPMSGQPMAQAPDVGTGWADFAARPTGPAGLGYSPQTAPMQALRAMRASGGLY